MHTRSITKKNERSQGNIKLVREGDLGRPLGKWHLTWKLTNVGGSCAGGREKTTFREGFRPAAYFCGQELSEVLCCVDTAPEHQQQLSAGLSTHSGGARERESSGSSYRAKTSHALPGEHSLSSAGTGHGSDAPARDGDKEDSGFLRHSTAFKSSSPLSPPQPVSPQKSKSVSWEGSDCGNWDPGPASVLGPWSRAASLLCSPPLTLFCHFLLKKLCWKILLGWHWLIKLYRFQVYNSITHHLYIVLCIHHPKSSLLPSPFIPSLLSSTSSTLFIHFRLFPPPLPGNTSGLAAEAGKGFRNSDNVTGRFTWLIHTFIKQHWGS